MNKISDDELSCCRHLLQEGMISGPSRAILQECIDVTFVSHPDYRTMKNIFQINIQTLLDAGLTP